MGERHDVGRRTGMTFTILCAGALAGPPISGAINTATGGFEDVGFYAGTGIHRSLHTGVLIRVCREYGGPWCDLNDHFAAADLEAIMGQNLTNYPRVVEGHH